MDLQMNQKHNTEISSTYYEDESIPAKFICSVPVKATNFEVQIGWIEENFGKYGENWTYYRTKFWFVNEADATLFRLKWT